MTAPKNGPGRDGRMKLEEIKKLIAMAEATPFSEVEIAEGDFRLRLVRRPQQAEAAPMPPMQAAPPQATPAARSAALEASSDVRVPATPERGKVTISPIVGTFYRSPAPDKPPYVEVGAYVKKGQVICIVEAMKLMNEIESEHEGKVVAILVEDGEPVEFGQPLVRIDA